MVFFCFFKKFFFLIILKFFLKSWIQTDRAKNSCSYVKDSNTNKVYYVGNPRYILSKKRFTFYIISNLIPFLLIDFFQTNNFHSKNNSFDSAYVWKELDLPEGETIDRVFTREFGDFFLSNKGNLYTHKNKERKKMMSESEINSKIINVKILKKFFLFFFLFFFFFYNFFIFCF